LYKYFYLPIFFKGISVKFVICVSMAFILKNFNLAAEHLQNSLRL